MGLACGCWLNRFGGVGGNALAQPQKRPFYGHVQDKRSQKAERKVSDQGEPSTAFNTPWPVLVNCVHDLFVSEIGAVSQGGDQAKSSNLG